MTPVGCGYGEGGPDADTLCWLDLSSYNDVAARSGAGQPLSVTLPGGYTVDFTVRTSGTRGIVPVAFPAWDYGSAIGKYIYLGTPGQPALYQTIGGGAGSTTIALTDIAVTDSDGNSVTGWRFVGADAESTANSESITFTSDVAVSVLATYTPPGGNNGCQIDIQQVDANTIRCTGGAVGDVYGTVLVSATEPSTFTQTMTVGNGASREAVAFAFQLATVSADLNVAGRVAPGDSFDVAVTSPEGQVVGSANTADGDTAGTGVLTVLPRIDGSSYTLGVESGAGTDLLAYDVSWACTVDGNPDVVAAAAAIEITPEAGDAIACVATVTPASTPGGGPATTEPPPGAPPVVVTPVVATPRFTG